MLTYDEFVRRWQSLPEARRQRVIDAVGDLAIGSQAKLPDAVVAEHCLAWLATVDAEPKVERTWRIEHDWTDEIYDGDGNLVAKLPRADAAKPIVNRVNALIGRTEAAGARVAELEAALRGLLREDLRLCDYCGEHQALWHEKGNVCSEHVCSACRAEHREEFDADYPDPLEQADAVRAALRLLNPSEETP